MTEAHDAAELGVDVPPGASRPLVTVVVGGTDRRGVVAALADRPGLAVVGEAEVSEVAAEAIGRVPDVVVLIDGADDPVAAVTAIGRALPAARILLAVHESCSVEPARLVDAGVGGVIGTGDLEAVATAVDGLAHGEGFPDAAIAAEVLRRHRLGESSVPLSSTEEAVLDQIADGDDIDAIATVHVVPPRLVRLHAAGAMARVGSVGSGSSPGDAQESDARPGFGTS